MPVDVLDDSDVAARPVDNAPEIIFDVAVHPVGIAPQIDSDAVVHPVDIALEIDSDVAVSPADIAPEINSHAAVHAVVIARVTSQIFNLECYTLDHHCISYFIAFLVDPEISRNSRTLGESWRFHYFHI